MIVPRYRQRTIYEGICRSLIPDQKLLLWEEWMLKIDLILEDDQLVELVHDALGRRRGQSRTRGRRSTPSEVVLRLMVLKHIKNWSYATLEREVRANLLYREFTHIGGEKVPDEKTLVRLGQALGPEVIRKIHERIVRSSHKRNTPATTASVLPRIIHTVFGAMRSGSTGIEEISSKRRSAPRTRAPGQGSRAVR